MKKAAMISFLLALFRLKLLAQKQPDSKALNDMEAAYSKLQTRLGDLEKKRLDLLNALQAYQKAQKKAGGEIIAVEKQLNSMSAPGTKGATGTTASLGSSQGANPIGSAAGGGQDQLLNATRQVQETQMSFNLQYLQLQSQMQAENRSYTAISDIMKTKHDTVKSSISNIR